MVGMVGILPPPQYLISVSPLRPNIRDDGVLDLVDGLAEVPDPPCED